MALFTWLPFCCWEGSPYYLGLPVSLVDLTLFVIAQCLLADTISSGCKTWASCTLCTNTQTPALDTSMRTMPMKLEVGPAPPRPSLQDCISCPDPEQRHLQHTSNSLWTTGTAFQRYAPCPSL